MIPLDVCKELRISSEEKSLNKIALPIIEDTIKEAISFKKGKLETSKIPTSLYEKDNFLISVEKPGKEVFLNTVKYKNGSLGNNPNDMTPVINIDNSRFPKNLTFDDIFQVFEGFIHEENLNLLEVIASLMFRQAFMLDHKKKDGVWRLKIPDATANYLKSNRPHINDLPILAFFYFLEALALNESVKYFSIGHSIKGGVGRQNNLLTYCNLIAVFLGKVRISKFAGQLSRPPTGVSPISQKAAREFFSPLHP